MNSMAKLNSSRSSSRTLMIWAWIDTSSADTGSSQTSTAGSVTMARAMPTRCCCPPLSSLGRRSATAAGSPTNSIASATASARLARSPMP